MKFQGEVAEPDFLAVADRLRATGKIVAIAQPHHVERFLRRQHCAMAGPGMIGMAVGDDRALDRSYRIDMEAAGLAAQAGGDGHQDVLRAHASYIGPIAPTFSQGNTGLTPPRIFRNHPDGYEGISD